MAHPRMYDPKDPLLARVRSIAFALPGGQEKESHGRPAFFTKKVFTYYGGSIKVEGEWISHDQAIMFLPDPEERPALEADERFWVPGYLGAYAWLAVDLNDDSDFDEVAELIESSYRLTAPARLISDLDAAQA